jgi:hypothetical protein
MAVLKDGSKLELFNDSESLPASELENRLLPQR